MVFAIHGTYKIKYHPNGVGEEPTYEVSPCSLEVAVLVVTVFLIY